MTLSKAFHHLGQSELHMGDTGDWTPPQPMQLDPIDGEEMDGESERQLE